MDDLKQLWPGVRKRAVWVMAAALGLETTSARARPAERSIVNLRRHPERSPAKKVRGCAGWSSRPHQAPLRCLGCSSGGAITPIMEWPRCTVGGKTRPGSTSRTH